MTSTMMTTTTTTTAPSGLFRDRSENEKSCLPSRPSTFSKVFREAALAASAVCGNEADDDDGDVPVDRDAPTTARPPRRALSSSTLPLDDADDREDDEDTVDDRGPER